MQVRNLVTLEAQALRHAIVPPRGLMLRHHVLCVVLALEDHVDRDALVLFQANLARFITDVFVVCGNDAIVQRQHLRARHGASCHIAALGRRHNQVPGVVSETCASRVHRLVGSCRFQGVHLKCKTVCLPQGPRPIQRAVDRVLLIRAHAFERRPELMFLPPSALHALFPDVVKTIYVGFIVVKFDPGPGAAAKGFSMEKVRLNLFLTETCTRFPLFFRHWLSIAYWWTVVIELKVIGLAQ